MYFEFNFTVKVRALLIFANLIDNEDVHVTDWLAQVILCNLLRVNIQFGKFQYKV